MMDVNKRFDLFVASKSGILKGINIEKTGCKIENISNLKSPTNNNRINVISWSDESETKILIGHYSNENKKGVTIYDTEKSSLIHSLTCDGDDGLFRDIACYDDAILTATTCGRIKLWRCESNAELLIEAGDNLNKMAYSKSNRNVVATGGKEHKLKLFDLEKKVKIFEEKNLPHDWLEMKLPLWISDIGFLQNSSEIATCSRYGHIRMYDSRTQRRPVIKLEMQDQALMKLAVAPRERHIIVGSGRGNMNLIDLRNPGRILNTYKDFVGSITAIACTQSNPFIITTSLDRYLRIHHMDTKKLLHKTYLTSRLSSMIIRSNISLDIDRLETDDTSSNESLKNHYFTDVIPTAPDSEIINSVSKRKKQCHEGQKKMKLK